MATNLIGEFLRARREQISPHDAGIAVNGHRRVPGLRRDELAMLAGISTEYYTRLEQGRDRRPSAQVLDAVARALHLDPEATAHLHGLADPAVPRRRLNRRPNRPTERVRPGIVRLIESWPQPAYIEGRYLDVLAANRLATLVAPVFVPGVNMLRAVLLDPRLRDVREDDVARMIAMLRGAVGADVDDPRLIELVGELSVKSEVFRRIWARHEVRPHPGSGLYRIEHPQVGPIELEYEKFAVTGAEDQTMVVYHVEPGSRSAEALSLLGMLDAPQSRS
ncbi:helix-turn-helix transcriptional regulator [Kineosporia sp. NBRC 101731]|uniref:helix-turn-helix domain-containing protein n=1 Tax=Kineosporia sp. NBRC 101731 TaxID=3032199 RepID=UPI0024A4B099|nr:helix-turn-helix transcriptional regulator [Kineosporia sp. NBRC 101731]GLY28171.1 transcriptional regulator [Kineosporia sp. NBRC 101731]